MAKYKGTKRQTTVYKTLHRKLKFEQHKPTKTEGDLRYSGRVDSSCTCGMYVLYAFVNDAGKPYYSLGLQALNAPSRSKVCSKTSNF